MRNRIEARTSAFRFHLILVAEVNSPGLHPLSPAFVNPLSLTPTSVDFHRLPSTSVDSRAVQSRFPDPANPVTVASRRGSQWQSVGRAAARSAAIPGGNSSAFAPAATQRQVPTTTTVFTVFVSPVTNSVPAPRVFCAFSCNGARPASRERR